MNPVQFKISSTEESTNIKGMTVFNTEKVDTKKHRLLFGVNLLSIKYCHSFDLRFFG